MYVPDTNTITKMASSDDDQNSFSDCDDRKEIGGIFKERFCELKNSRYMKKKIISALKKSLKSNNNKIQHSLTLNNVSVSEEREIGNGCRQSLNIRIDLNDKLLYSTHDANVNIETFKLHDTTPINKCSHCEKQNLREDTFKSYFVCVKCGKKEERRWFHDNCKDKCCQSTSIYCDNCLKCKLTSIDHNFEVLRDTKFAKYMYVVTCPNGGGISLHMDYEKMVNLTPEQQIYVAKEFLKEAFKEDKRGFAQFTIAIVHNGASFMPDLLKLLAELHPNLPVKTTKLKCNIETENMDLGTYYTKVKETYNNGTFAFGPLNETQAASVKNDECGAYLPELLSLLEKSPFLSQVLPWSDMTTKRFKTPHESDDGPIFWCRPGEQIVSLDKNSKRNRWNAEEIESFLKERRQNLKYFCEKRFIVEELKKYRRSYSSREFLFEDRTKPHADQVWGNHFEPTAAVGVIQAVHPDEIPEQNRACKEIVVFHAKHFEMLEALLHIDVTAAPKQQCAEWLDDAKLNMIRQMNIKYSKLHLYDNDIYFIPRKIVHQFKTISATLSVAWHTRLIEYYVQEPPTNDEIEEKLSVCSEHSSKSRSVTPVRKKPMKRKHQTSVSTDNETPKKLRSPSPDNHTPVKKKLPRSRSGTPAKREKIAKKAKLAKTPMKACDVEPKTEPKDVEVKRAKSGTPEARKSPQKRDKSDTKHRSRSRSKSKKDDSISQSTKKHSETKKKKKDRSRSPKKYEKSKDAKDKRKESKSEKRSRSSKSKESRSADRRRKHETKSRSRSGTPKKHDKKAHRTKSPKKTDTKCDEMTSSSVSLNTEKLSSPDKASFIDVPELLPSLKEHCELNVESVNSTSPSGQCAPKVESPVDARCSPARRSVSPVQDVVKSEPRSPTLGVDAVTVKNEPRSPSDKPSASVTTEEIISPKKNSNVAVKPTETINNDKPIKKTVHNDVKSKDYRKDKRSWDAPLFSFEDCDKFVMTTRPTKNGDKIVKPRGLDSLHKIDANSKKRSRSRSKSPIGEVIKKDRKSDNSEKIRSSEKKKPDRNEKEKSNSCVSEKRDKDKRSQVDQRGKESHKESHSSDKSKDRHSERSNDKKKIHSNAKEKSSDRKKTTNHQEKSKTKSSHSQKRSSSPENHNAKKSKQDRSQNENQDCVNLSEQVTESVTSLAENTEEQTPASHESGSYQSNYQLMIPRVQVVDIAPYLNNKTNNGNVDDNTSQANGNELNEASRSEPPITNETINSEQRSEQE